MENVSNLLKLHVSIWIKKLEIEIYFKQIYVKIVKTALEKWLPWQKINWYVCNQQTIVFLDKAYKNSQNVVVIAVFVAKIRIFEICAGTLCPPPPSPAYM